MAVLFSRDPLRDRTDPTEVFTCLYDKNQKFKFNLFIKNFILTLKNLYNDFFRLRLVN
jgi:hypothetical protein